MRRSWPIVMGLTVVVGLVLAVWRWGFMSAVPRPLKHLSIETPPEAPIAISADGLRLVHTLRDRGEVVLQVRSVDGSQRLRLRGALGARAPFFSPDGASIGYVSGGSLMKVPASGGKAEVVTSVEDFAGATWALRDEIVFASSSGLYRVAARGGVVSRLARPGEGERALRWPQHIRATMWILFEVALDSGVSRVDALSLETGDRRVLVREASLPRFASPDHVLFVRGNTLWGTALDRDRLEVIGRPQLLFRPEEPGERIWYDISDNGTLVVGYPELEGPSIFTIVVHWDGELARLLPVDANVR